MYRSARLLIHGQQYVLVCQVTDTRTTRYRAVPPKSTIGGQFRPSAIDEGEIDHRRSIEGEKEKKKKKRKRRKKREEERIPRAILARVPSPLAGRPRAVVHFVLKELVRKSIGETESDIAAAANEALERFRDDSRKTVLRLVEMESAYLTVDFFRKLSHEPDKGSNPGSTPNTPAPDRYGSNVSAYVGMLLLLLQKKQLSAMLDEDPSLMEKRNAIAKRLELYKHARGEIDSVGWK
ncbi:hypothetical protein GW17_00013770 [Ensete ventricosum]|nr:hypothetical protein GW17_00013770 [Ensete ventricosum]